MPNDSMTLRFFFQQKHIPFLLFLAPRIKQNLTEAGKLKEEFVIFSYQEALKFGIYAKYEPVKQEITEFIESDLSELLGTRIKSDPDAENFLFSRPFISWGSPKNGDFFWIYLDPEINWESLTSGLLEGRWSPDPFSWQIRLRSEVD